MNQSILWRRIDLAGHEACRLHQLDNEWRLEGTAVFSKENRPCRLSYLVACDSSWNTLRGSVSGWVGDQNMNVEITVTSHSWTLNGIEKPAVYGCVDVDLNFSPATNLIPIRRLNLELGQHAEVNAAWLRFPAFELEPLEQVYTRLDEFRYRYSSGGGSFVCDLTVNETGFVIDYPGLWEAE